MKKRIMSIIACVLAVLCCIVSLPIAVAAETDQEPLLISVDLGYESDNSSNGEGINGMSYIFRLSDGRFIIYDGGWNSETMAQRVLEALHANSVTDNIVIAAWVVTHPHQDHMGVIQYFANNYKDAVTVEKVIYKFPSADYIAANNLTNKVEAFTSAVEMFGAQTITPVVGTPIVIGDAVIEIIYVTPESGLSEVNASSLVSRVRLGTRTFMMTADSTPTVLNKIASQRDDLKSDYMTVPHHGLAPVEYNEDDLDNTYYCNSFYSKVDAGIVLWPRSTYSDINDTDRNAYFFDDTTKPNEIIASDETRVIRIVNVICNNAWERGISQSFASGTGTEDDPYIIKTPNQLAYLGDSLYKASDPEIYTGKYFKLAANINMNNKNICVGGETGRQMIGTPEFTDESVVERPFKGNFDGDGYTISNIKVSEASCTGLFGVIANATIKNLNITTSNSGNTDATIAGILVGKATNSTIIGCTISYSTVKARQYIGGIVGQAQNTEIKYCTSSAVVNDTQYASAANVLAGGILGYSPDSVGGNTIEYCMNFGEVSITPKAGGILSAGGIAGYITAGDRVSHCVNTASVSGSTELEKIRLTVAGISGRVRSNSNKDAVCTIDSCYNILNGSETLTATADSKNAGLINGHINSGKLTITNNKSVSVGTLAINGGGNPTVNDGNDITETIDIAPVYSEISDNKSVKPRIAGVQEGNDGNSLRFIMGIDSLDYANVEFQIDASYTVGGVTYTVHNGYKPITKAYSSILANGETLTAVECGSRYFATMTVTGIPTDVGDIVFTIRAYLKDLAGNAVLADVGTYIYTVS